MGRLYGHFHGLYFATGLSEQFNRRGTTPTGIIAFSRVQDRLSPLFHRGRERPIEKLLNFYSYPGYANVRGTGLLQHPPAEGQHSPRARWLEQGKARDARAGEISEVFLIAWGLSPTTNISPLLIFACNVDKMFCVCPAVKSCGQQYSCRAVRSLHHASPSCILREQGSRQALPP